jgi:FkbM family methyltransferase
MSLKSFLFERLLPYLPGRLILLVNIFSKDKIKIKDASLIVVSKLRSHHILRSRVALYRKGLSFRGQQLGKSYHLDKINFLYGDLIVDVGSNVGDLILYLPTAVRYIGLEPSPEEFNLLRLNVDKDCRIFNYAAIDTNRQVSFYINSEEADSSIFEPTSHSKIINIQGIRLDSLIKEKVKLLKIDAEGGELEVLIGCENILRLVTYIAIDCGFEKGKNRESTFIPCLKFLQSHGFELLEVGRNFRFLFKNSISMVP